MTEIIEFIATITGCQQVVIKLYRSSFSKYSQGGVHESLRSESLSVDVSLKVSRESLALSR